MFGTYFFFLKHEKLLSALLLLIIAGAGINSVASHAEWLLYQTMSCPTSKSPRKKRHCGTEQ